MGNDGMNRLQKFIKQGKYGDKPGRVAYAFEVSLLPAPALGMTWQTMQPFSAADELINDTGLRFKGAFDNGFAVVMRLG
jgi:hypothetical protein